MTGQNIRRRLIIAVREADAPLARAILGKEFELVFCHTLENAQTAMDEQVAMVVCGVHFAQGAVFEFLQFVRSSATVNQLPFFVLLDTKGRYHYSPAIIHGLRAAAKALGATQFVDLNALVEKMGKEEAVEVLRKGIRDVLSGPDE